MPDTPALDRPPSDARAYVTLVTNADYLPGAIALLNSLRRTATTADIVVLATGGVDPTALAPLAANGARLGAYSTRGLRLRRGRLA